MSIQIVEIALPSVIDTVAVAQPSTIAVVEIRQGPVGPSGGAGTVGWDDLIGTASQVPFAPVTPPAYAEGLVFYDTDDKSLVYYGDEPDTAMNIGRELWVRVRNDSGAPILNGKVVYINDAIGQLPTIRLARADSAVTSRVIGIATHDIGNNEFGYVTTAGEVKGLNTVAFQDGDLLFLSADTAGELTTTAPTAPNRVIQVATVLHAHISQGKLYCHPENDSVPSTGIVDSTATGRALITAATAGAARTTLGLSSGDSVTFANATFSSGTITTSQPLALTQTWNNAAVTFTGLQVNVTDTASNAASLLMDLRVGSNSLFRVSRTGAFFASGVCQIGTSSTPYWQATGAESGVMTLGAAYSLAWRSSNIANSGVNDLFLVRDAANTLAQRNGGNAQAFRLYNTYTSATNFERLNFRWDTNVAKIGTEKGSTGGVARDLALETDGAERVRVLAANGNFGIGTQAPTQRLDVVGSIKASQPIIFPSYTVAQLQALTASAYTAAMAYCTDEAAGTTMAFCDGTNWRRVQDRAIISIAP